MTVFVAFLRGVNVAGHRKIKMDALRAVHEAMGHAKVATYLQSGNVVFKGTAKSPRKLAADIERAYQSQLGLSTTVILRSASDLARIVAHCPIALSSGRDPKFLHAVLLSGQPDESAIKTLTAYDGPEEFRIIGDTLYVYYTYGSGRSKLSLTRIEAALGLDGTARNWNTVTKLREMATHRSTDTSAN
jgi:uncharacterized protein (DUF1697 family)